MRLIPEYQRPENEATSGAGRQLSIISCLLLAVGAVAAPIDPAKLPPPANRTVDFKQDIYPILASRCFECHRGVDAVSGYRLDQRSSILGETDGRPLAVVGDSGKSQLIHLVAGQVPKRVMPKKGERLTAEQVGLLRAWIDQGLKWDDELVAGSDESRHWAFQPVTRPAIPSVKNPAWVRTPIDAFIAAKQEAKGVTPLAEADRRTLIRRLSLDLLGLPPTPEEIDAFVNDTAANAYEKLVDQLLASAHCGERWGRHWLDLARYADSEGYESDHTRPYMWRYRDYVVRSFNQDRPFDRFIREQVAGDELSPYADEQLIATGFLATARLSSNEEDRAIQTNDMLVDVVNATGNAILGLTFNCCQCHNHKFDALTIRDYYRFQGFFVKGMPNNLVLRDPALWEAYNRAKPPEFDPADQLRQAMFEAARQKLNAEARQNLSPEQRAALDIPADKRTPEQQNLAREADLKFQFTPNRIEKAIPAEDQPLYAELKKKLEALQKKMPDRPQTFGFYSPATSPNKVDVLPMKGFYPPPYRPDELAKARPYLLRAGNVQERLNPLDVGWPMVFGPTPAAVEQKPRTVLADWLTSPKHPLTARVWVNRLWQWHFGRGIVATPNDFGTRGSPPSHPELLDWLASELIEKQWSTKHIQRLIVNSATYRLSARRAEGVGDKLDPDNHLWWHWPLRRLEVEAIRDSLLAVSGELDRQLGGPPTEKEDDSVRRTLYLLQRRNKPPQVQKLFDGPTAALESCPKRHTSTVPLQTLYLLNNRYALNRAKAFAERVAKAAGGERSKQVESAFRLALGRMPDPAERSAAERFFAAVDGEEALAQFCQALMNLNEFVYLE